MNQQHSTPPLLPIQEHLIELRKCIIRCLIGFMVAFILGYVWAEPLFNYLVSPLANLLKSQINGHHLIYTGLTEAFLTYIKLAGFAALFTCFPLFVMQLWLFIAPGLYQHERRLFIVLLLATPILFILGAGFAFYVILPAAYQFFLSFETPGSQGLLPIHFEPRVSEYLSFVIRLLLSFGISFELPILLSVLAWAKIIQAKTLIAGWRIAVVAIVAISAIVTPPDVLSMIGLAIPLILLYGLSIAMVRWIEYRQSLKKDKSECLISD